MKRLVLLSCALAVSTSLACGSTSSETTVGPTPVRCGVSVSNSPRNFPHAGGGGSLAIAAARECSWSVSTQTAWISLANPVEGQGDATVKYTVARNPAATARSGVLSVGGQSAQVTQEAAPCTFDLDRRTFEFSGAQASGRVEVAAPGGCSWEASANVAWITIVAGSQGNGQGEVRFDVSANSTPSPRTGRLTVAGLEVTVRQLAAGAPGPPGPGDCTYAVEPPSAAVGSDQTDGTFAVLTDAPCEWTATSDAGWLAVVSGGSGSGAGEVSYRAAENTGSSSRTGRITVEDAVFTVVQDGRTPPPCDYGISPTSRSFGSGGGTGEIDVDAGLLCSWTAQSLDSWIHITSGSSGLGDGEVDYTVDPNSGAARTGTIRVAGHNFTVTQAADVVTISGDVDDVSGSCPETTFTVRNQPVRTTGATNFRGGSCQNQLREGADVRVTGTVGGDGVLAASDVRFLDDD